MSKYKFLDKRDSAKSNSPKPSGISFNDNRPENLQMRNLQRQINSSAVVQKQAELQNGVNGVLQCYKTDTIEGYRALVSDDKDAIIYKSYNQILYVNSGKKPEPSDQFENVEKRYIKKYNKEYKGYRSKHEVGKTLDDNDCGCYASLLVNNAVGMFDSKNMEPVTHISKNKNLLFDIGNRDSDKYIDKEQDPGIREVYYIGGEGFKGENVKNHVAAVVYKTKNENITSELDAGDDDLTKPYFNMYNRSANKKEGKTFIEYNKELRPGIAGKDIKSPVLVNPKLYYEKIGHKFIPYFGGPGRIKLKISSDNDSGDYRFTLRKVNYVRDELEDISGKTYIDAGATKGSPVEITFDYKGCGMENLLLFISKKKKSKNNNKTEYEHKYMGLLDIADMLRDGKKKVTLKHLEEKKNWCCFGSVLSFTVECEQVPNYEEKKDHSSSSILPHYSVTFGPGISERSNMHIVGEKK